MSKKSDQEAINKIKDITGKAYNKYEEEHGRKGTAKTDNSKKADKESSKDKSKGKKATDPLDVDKNSNKGNSATTGALNNQQANVSGIPAETTPYVVKYSNVLRDDNGLYDNTQRITQQVTATFSTQIGDVNASYTIGRADVDPTITAEYITKFEDELLSFETVNDKNQDTPTFQITVTGMRDWEDLLLVNDYVQVGVEQWNKDLDVQADYYKTLNIDGHYTATLITGLVSDVRKVQDAATNNRTYVIVCQGMQKILDNINLATLTELMGYSAYLLYDSSTFGGDGFDPNKDGGSGGSGDGGDVGNAVGTGKAADIAKAAQWALKNHAGGKYSLGYHGKDNWDNNDCSGFVSMVCNRAGVDVGLLTTWGFADSSKFKRVNKGDFASGDLVEWNNQGHIGVYIGNGKSISFDGPNDPQGIVENDVNFMPIDFGLRVK